MSDLSIGTDSSWFGRIGHEGKRSVPTGEASTPNASEQGFSWNLVAVDPEQVRVLVRHYGHRYPALDWSWLLQSLAELRLVGEPRLAVTKLLEQQQLESAERFLLDVGLWVVAGEELTLP